MTTILTCVCSQNNDVWIFPSTSQTVFIDLQEKTKCINCKVKCDRTEIGYHCLQCNALFNACDVCFDPNTRLTTTLRFSSNSKSHNDEKHYDATHYVWNCDECQNTFTTVAN